MSRNTCEGRQKIEDRPGFRLALSACAMVAIGLSATGVPAGGGYHLAARLPRTIRRGEPAVIVLDVQRNGRPADGAAACMATSPVFASEEDLADSTPAGGVDLGSGGEAAAQPACVTAMAAVRTAPGVYQFTWEPDAAGRVNLHFTVAGSRLDVPVNVASPGPDPAILAGFVVLIGLILATAASMRRARQRQGGPS